MNAPSDEVLEALATRLGPTVRRQASTAALTTYGAGGPAALQLMVAHEDQLAVVAAALASAAEPVPVLVVGLGSNLLVADDGFPGLVLVLGPAFAEVEIDGTTVRAGARAKLPVVARQTAAAGLTGFEWAAGVPGSIGGAVRMNAGVPDADMADALVRVRVVDLGSGHDGQVPAADLHLGYRTSSITAAQVVVGAELELTPADPEVARAAIKEKTQWRRDHQPGGRNAGSVFTNPEGDSAGRLIEAAGLKGLRIGTAEVSPKHANFIQSDEGGRAADIWALMVEVRRRVHQHAGVDLHPETHLVGFDPMPELAP
ncbi:UDP-N-acetylmuramate dehydrogenase [Aquihabitans sp. McL0605]|uniref:UDP-N-acetylmuramate dehydrogenase n=1 Tax=Aquihabitans sp. McL0605 TaxID=3415671 RepID=UPI003CF58A1E